MSPSHEPHGSPSLSDRLLSHAGTLPFPARMRWLAEQARGLATADYRAILADLGQGTLEARQIGLHLAVARGDLDVVSRALRDPLLGHRALAAAIRLPVPDAELKALVEDAPRARRLAVYGVLRRSRRRALAGELVSRVHDDYGRDDVAALLPACAPEVIAQWLPRIGATGDLRRLAKLAPRAVLEVLAGKLAALDRSEWQWLRANRELIESTAAQDPESFIRILITEPGLTSVILRSEQVLLRLLTRPDLLIGLPEECILGTRRFQSTRLPRQARQAVAALTTENAAKLIKRLVSRPVQVAVLRAHAPSRRREILALAFTGADPGRSDVALLRTLPLADRAELVPPLLTDRQALQRGWKHLEILSALPFAAARAELEAATSSHYHQERRLAWRTLLQCAVAEREPGVAAGVLQAAGRAWHDQESVRLAALKVTADLPVRVLAAVPVDVLRDAIGAATNAPDTTGESLELLVRWTCRAASATASHGDGTRLARLLGLLARVLADRRCPRMTVPRLPGGTARQLWPELREKVLRDARAERFGATLRLASLLRADLAELPELDALLGELARSSTDPDVAAEAARLWIHDPATREERVAELVAHDPPRGRIVGVWEVVATRRTDLVDRVLATGGPVPGRSRGRWTAAQQARASTVAESVATDVEADLWDRVTAAGAVTDPARLAELAGTAPEPIAAAALGALASAESAIPVLLRHAGRPAGPAARAAVRGLRSALALLPDRRASELAGQVLLAPGSVGAAKEAVRLLAELCPPGAMDVFADAWSGAHRDVRVAIAAALVRFPDGPATPALLAEAIRGTDQAVRTAALTAGPAAVPAAHQPTWARMIAGALDLTDPPALAQIVAAYGVWWPHAPDGVERLRTMVTATADDDVFTTAGRVLADIAFGGPGEQILAGAFDALAEAARGRDPVAWRRLTHLADLTGRGGPFRYEGNAPAMRVAIDACRSAGLRSTAIWLLSKLALRTLDHRHGPLELSCWDELVVTIAEQPVVWHTHGLNTCISTPEGLDRARIVMDHLVGLDGPVPVLLAIDVIKGVRIGSGQTSEWADRLAAWYAHPDPVVREEAFSVRVENWTQ